MDAAFLLWLNYDQSGWDWPCSLTVFFANLKAPVSWKQYLPPVSLFYMVSLCAVFASAVNRQGDLNISRKCRPTRTGRLDFFFLVFLKVGGLFALTQLHLQQHRKKCSGRRRHAATDSGCDPTRCVENLTLLRSAPARLSFQASLNNSFNTYAARWQPVWYNASETALADTNWRSGAVGGGWVGGTGSTLLTNEHLQDTGKLRGRQLDQWGMDRLAK